MVVTPEILLAEDYEPDVRLAFILFKKNRIANRIHVVRDGQEALDFVFCRGAYADRTFDQLPQVALLDIRLPKVDGWEVLRQIKQNPRTSKISVIMTSGSVFANEIQKSESLGAAGCLEKSFKFETLREILARAGLRWFMAEPVAD
jgi:two-component system response regulator